MIFGIDSYSRIASIFYRWGFRIQIQVHMPSFKLGMFLPIFKNFQRIFWELFSLKLENPICTFHFNLLLSKPAINSCYVTLWVIKVGNSQKINLIFKLQYILNEITVHKFILPNWSVDGTVISFNSLGIGRKPHYLLKMSHL